MGIRMTFDGFEADCWDGVDPWCHISAPGIKSSREGWASITLPASAIKDLRHYCDRVLEQMETERRRLEAKR
jgi:hypothetical protein